jgi:putative sterol carrier protein
MEIPSGTTVHSLVESVVPAFHAQLVPEDASVEPLAVAVRIGEAGSWTVRIRGREMSVVPGEVPSPTLWLFTTVRAVERFLEDATGPRRLLPKFEPVGGPAGVAALSDPRVVRRVAMANGRMELALRDDDGERLALVMGFGAATRKPIDPDEADVVIETDMATLERVLAGTLAPEDALVDGGVRVRGNRMLALQLALAIAPFYPSKTKRR